MIRSSLRTPELSQRYVDYRKSLPADEPCKMCALPATKEFVHWKIVKNDFPYDVIAEAHDMIMPLRHTIENGLMKEEWQEWLEIKEKYVGDNYEYVIEPVPKHKSYPDHFHLHLITAKLIQ